MRKILTKEEQEKKKQRNQLVVGGILILIMLLSTAGYALVNNEKQGNSKQMKYKGTKFNMDDNGYWDFVYNSEQYITMYNPDEVKDVGVLSKVTLDFFKSKPLYFVTESNSPEPEIMRNFYQRIPSRIQNACLSGTNCTKIDFPIKECGGNDNIIIVREPSSGESERVYQDKKCIYFVASYGNESKVADAFLFNTLGL